MMLRIGTYGVSQQAPGKSFQTPLISSSHILVAPRDARGQAPGNHKVRRPNTVSKRPARRVPGTVEIPGSA